MDAGHQFLTATGQISDANRQEWILASDTLGVSMLVDAINHRRPGGATENTVLGPFHVAGAPERANGDSICLDGKGAPCTVEGRVLDEAGNPIAGAKVDVWQTNDDGLYNVQQLDVQPEMNMRGIFTTDEAGRYAFVTVKPLPYSIPPTGRWAVCSMRWDATPCDPRTSTISLPRRATRGSLPHL